MEGHTSTYHFSIIRGAFAVAVIGALLSFNSSNECIELLKKCYEKMNAVSTQLAADKMLHIEMETTTHFTERMNMDKHTETFSLYATKEKSYMEAQVASVYQDSKHIVTVLHSTKLVMITNVGKEKQNHSLPISFNEEQLNNIRIVDCSEKMYQGKKMRYLKYTDKEESKKFVEFYIDGESNDIKRMMIKGYSDEVDALEYAYKKVENNLPLNEQINQSALSKVLSSSGKLLPKYSSYTLQDLRKTK